MHSRARRATSVTKPVMESLHDRVMLSVTNDGLTPPVTVLSLPTIPRLSLTTYHGTVVDSKGQSADVAMHVNTFTHTGHFTATLTVYNSRGALTGTVTGVIKSNLHVIFTYSLSGYGQTASGTGSGKVNTTGKTLKATLTGTANGQPFSGTMVVSRK